MSLARTDGEKSRKTSNRIVGGVIRFGDVQSETLPRYRIANLLGLV